MISGSIVTVFGGMDRANIICNRSLKILAGPLTNINGAPLMVAILNLGDSQVIIFCLMRSVLKASSLLHFLLWLTNQTTVFKTHVCSNPFSYSHCEDNPNISARAGH